MSEIKKTYTYGGIAFALMILAFISSPGDITPDAFLDQGEPFFPEFVDPNAALTLEVVDYDDKTGSARPFKVSFTGGRWIIPSHHDYLADGADRLSKTAAGVIGINKDDFRSDNVSEHEVFGVIDPLDNTSASLQGRGQRVTIKGANEAILADFIIGNEVENRPGFRFVRVPDQKRVYAVRMDIDISTKFSDWIEADLLKVEKIKIEKVVLKDYTVNEQTGTIDQRDNLILNKTDDGWTADDMSEDQEVDDTVINDLITAIDELSIVGVRPKPEGLSRSLQSSNNIALVQRDLLDLQRKGYFFTRESQLVSNEGELQAATTDGIIYTMRFGEILYGVGESVSAGTDSTADETSGPGENRYLFITANFENNYFTEPEIPENLEFQEKADSLWTDTDRANEELHDTHEEWKQNVENGLKLSAELNNRFADWYYVISAEIFDKLRKKRSDLIKEKEEGGGE
ncbi:DUF4340 domain-containing protein [candidate division KSB1 bacterium]|nr:DUF4340 domain-containing protein [candidate division KSB1 bacterium]